MAGEKKLEPRGYVKASLQLEMENRMQNCYPAPLQQYTEWQLQSPTLPWSFGAMLHKYRKY